jgi:WD40 repeat protein
LLLMIAGWPLLVTEIKPLCGVAFSPDGRQLATLRGIPYDVFDPPMRFELAVWDVAAKRERLVIPLNEPGWGMAFSPDGKTLAYGTQAGSIELYDADSGRRVNAWAAGAAHATNWLAFAGNSRLLVANGGVDGPTLWDATTGKLLAVATEAAGGSYYSIQGAQLAVGRLDRSTGTKKTWIYDLSRQRFEIATTLREAGSCALSSDARLLAVDRNRDVQIIDLATGRLDRTLENSWATELGFSPVGSLLAVRKYRSATSEQIVELWDPTSDKRPDTLLKSRISPVHARLGMGLISFSRDGARIAIGNEVGEVRVWDVSSRQLLAELPNVAVIRWKTITFVALLIAWCTAWVAAGRQSEWRFPAWVDAAGINLLLAALLCLRLFGAGQLFCDPRRPAMWLALAILASWLMLAAFWATFGHIRWPPRLAGLVFALSVSWAVLFLLLPSPHLRDAVSLLSIGTTCLLGWWLVVSVLARLAGYRLASAAVLLRAASPAKQINLKDLLLWTAAVASLLAVARLLQTNLFSFRAIVTIVAYTGLLAIAAVNAAYLALSPSRLKMQCISLAAVSVICGYAASLLSTAEFERVRNWQIGFFVVFASAVWASLAVFAAHAYRLKRDVARLHAILGTLRFGFGKVRTILAIRVW